MRVVISGVTGFLGSNLANFFISQGFEVVGIKRPASNLSRLSGISTNSKFALVDTENMESIFQSPVNVVIHTATNYGRGGEGAGAIEASNVWLPMKLWQYSQKNGVVAFFNTDTFMSTETPKEDRYFQYVVTKKQFLAQAKATLKQSTTKFINMVVFHMYGANDNPEKFLAVMAKRMLKNEPEIQLTTGEQVRDFIYISDVVAAFAAGLKNLSGFSEFEEFNIGTGQAHALREVVEYLHKTLGSKSHLAWGALENRQHDQIYGAANITGNGKLGWKAEISLETGLKKTAEYYKNNI